jgi:DNA-binding ferritin-like protein (Dps family)
MGNTKDPLNEKELEQSDNYIRTLEPNSYEYQLCKLIRYTGMHSICTYHPRANVRIVQLHGDFIVKWARPKKGARKGEKAVWEDVRGVPLHGELDFDIVAFYKANVKRNKKLETKRRKVARTITKVYWKIAPGTTPNSLRHTFAMELLKKHHLPEKDVAEMIGTTVKTLKEYYDRVGQKQSSNQMRATGWNQPKLNNPNMRKIINSDNLEQGQPQGKPKKDI